MRTRASWAVLWLCACGSEQGAPEPQATQPTAVTASEAAASVKEESPFDAQGRLRPSGRFLTWLELPRGFEELPSSRPHSQGFRARDVTVEQTRDYLSERMLSGIAEPLGQGVIYRAVLPLSGAADAPRYDLTVVPRENGKAVELWIETRSVSPADTLSVSEARKVLAEEQRRAE